ncbi:MULTISPECIES: FecR family protein [Bacteroides]|jgi:transmembrane sensor|uniref:FecR family protein n=1 Tax=Bacteroides TaxID=816 RepID=UPI00164BD3F0|nr:MULTISPECIES: FecR family protein [Bacteroides]MBC5586656.1 FecR family protein [Bacteroides sp. NSJ-39]
MDKELLHTYFRGEATPEEEKQIMDWAESSPENYQEYLKERKIWNAILMYSVNPTIKATATHKRLFLSLYKYAAIAVIAFGVGFYTLHNRNVPGDFLSHLSPMDISEPVLLQNNQKYIALGAESFSLNEQKGIVKNNHTDRLLSYHQEDASRGFSFGKKRADNRLLVPQGQTYKLALADGTNVMLNAESELTFPSEFDTDRREVFLKGEAFFQVTHNEKAPFIVHTDQLDVQVLGTTFNVSGYNNENMLKVTLVEGSIRIHQQGDSVKIRPNEQYNYNKNTREKRVQTVDTELFTSWVNDEYIFKDTTLDEIFNRINHWYMFDVTYESPSLKEKRFFLTIGRDASLDQIIQIINSTEEVCIEKKDNHIVVKNIPDK